ncbi:hypothetical protein [Microcystis phage Mae-JY04]|uniref:hypothetical protein n=1 Tax=Blastomonas sp. TaxID=1909299 RepID=UPI00259117B2|nr:hypothetical protein [Blastomonas sp.]
MSRELSPELEAELLETGIRPFMALFIDFPDPVRAFTGRGKMMLGGHEFLGIHGIASIDTIGETVSGSASGVRATLLAVPSEFAEDIADQAVRGCAYEMYAGAFDLDFQTVVGHQRIWKGTLQGYEILDEGSSITVTAIGESRQIDQRRPAVKRYTDEYQQRKFPGDRFFEYLPRLTEVPILWAKGRQDPL